MDIYGNKRQIFTITLTGVARSDYAVTKLQQKLIKTGGSMSAALSTVNNQINGILNPTSVHDAATKIYTDNVAMTQVSKTGDIMGNSISMNLNIIIDVGDPTSVQDAITKST